MASRLESYGCSTNIATCAAPALQLQEHPRMLQSGRMCSPLPRTLAKTSCIPPNNGKPRAEDKGMCNGNPIGPLKGLYNAIYTIQSHRKGRAHCKLDEPCESKPDICCKASMTFSCGIWLFSEMWGLQYYRPQNTIIVTYDRDPQKGTQHFGKPPSYTAGIHLRRPLCLLSSRIHQYEISMLKLGSSSGNV